MDVSSNKIPKPVSTTSPEFNFLQTGSRECSWFSVKEAPFVLSGFPFIKNDGVFCRYPVNPPEPLPPAVESNAWGPSGGQIRFSANTSQVKLRVKLIRPATPSWNIIPISDLGFDLYASPGDGYYTLCGVPKFDPEKDFFEHRLLNLEKPQKLDFIINFPLRMAIESVEIGLDEGCIPEAPPPFVTDSRILIYGGSIIHGFCASRPGMTMPNILSRRLNREVINMGVNGSAKCEQETAKAIREIDNVSLFIISPEGNCPSVEFMYEHIPRFIGLYREKHPTTPIALMSYMREGRERIDDYARQLRKAKRECEIRIVEEFKNRGDKNIHFWDGEEFTSPENDIFFENHSMADEATTDVQHKSDIGFWLMANGVMRKIKEMNV